MKDKRGNKHRELDSVDCLLKACRTLSAGIRHSGTTSELKLAVFYCRNKQGAPDLKKSFLLPGRKKIVPQAETRHVGMQFKAINRRLKASFWIFYTAFLHITLNKLVLCITLFTFSPPSSSWQWLWRSNAEQRDVERKRDRRAGEGPGHCVTGLSIVKDYYYKLWHL